MAHNRTNLRNAIETAFSSITFAVLIEQARRIDSSMRPCALLTLADDAAESDQRTMADPVFVTERAQSCVIELHAEGATGRDVVEAIDSMELEIEGALAADLTLDDLCELIEPEGSTLEMSAEQDTVIGSRSVVYNITWRAPFGSPDAPEV